MLLTTLNQFGADEETISDTSLLLKAVVVPADKTTEGQLIESVALPWFEIIEFLKANPTDLHQIGWRKWEELVAGAYRREGFEVTLTPPSGDSGRDVIATSRELGSIRVVDQVKAYKPGRVVTADEVRSMVGVLGIEQNVSKGIVTTTSKFAPNIRKDPNLAKLMPYRLDLKDGQELLDWLVELASRRVE